MTIEKNLLIMLILLIMVVSCGQQQSKTQSYDALRSEKISIILESYKNVLLSEAEYFDVKLKKNVLLNDYWTWFSENEYSGPINKEFTMVDLDGDGVPEAIIMYDPGLLKVFHQEEGTVYGFTFGFRAMAGLKKDGSYDWSGSAFHSGVGRQTFSGTNTGSVNIYESISDSDDEENVVYYIYNNQVTAHHSRDFWAARNKIEEVEWTPFTDENINNLKEWSITQYMYVSIPDPMFPIPMLRGEVVPYDDFSPPEEVYVMTTYIYEDDSFKESYKQQLREAGFVEQENAPQWMESMWRYDRIEDGATLMVELLQEDNPLSIRMYVNYFIDEKQYGISP